MEYVFGKPRSVYRFKRKAMHKILRKHAKHTDLQVSSNKTARRAYWIIFLCWDTNKAKRYLMAQSRCFQKTFPLHNLWKTAWPAALGLLKTRPTPKGKVYLWKYHQFHKTKCLLARIRDHKQYLNKTYPELKISMITNKNRGYPMNNDNSSSPLKRDKQSYPVTIKSSQSKSLTKHKKTWSAVLRGLFREVKVEDHSYDGQVCLLFAQRAHQRAKLWLEDI